jgi:hypothetical protein
MQTHVVFHVYGNVSALSAAGFLVTDLKDALILMRGRGLIYNVERRN